MKRVYFLTLIMIISFPIFGQEYYYWYKGEKIPLHKGNQSYILYESHDARIFDTLQIIESGNVSFDKNIKWGIIEDNTLTKANNIIYRTQSFTTSDSTHNIFVTHRFYVKLKAIEDTIYLQNLVRQNNAVIEKRGCLPLMYIIRCDFSSTNNALDLANRFYESKMFAWTEPEFIHFIYPESACVNDVFFPNQWNLENTGQHDTSCYGFDINYCSARSITSGNSSVIVGVLDWGVDLTHSDINIYSISYDAHTLSSPSRIYDNHGTAVAGIISAKSNNTIGVAGIAPNCPIMSISMDYSTTQENVVEGINFAVNNGCAVINNSWESLIRSHTIGEEIFNAITNGRSGKGCVITFASGNNNNDNVSYPASAFPEILTVGAISPNGKRKTPYSYDNLPWGSNYGTALDVVGPGVFIYTTDIVGQNGYTSYDYTSTFWGTSAACPHVSAIAALMLSVNPYLTQKEVVDIIESTAQKVQPCYTGNYDYSTTEGRPNGTWNTEMGYGLVDAYAAVAEAKSRYIQGPDYVCDTTKYYLIHPSQPGDAVLWSVNNGNYIYPHYSIIGANNQDTVYIRCERASVVRTSDSEPQENSNENTSLDDRQILPVDQSVSVSINNGTSNTYTKMFRNPFGTKPEVSISNTSSLWNSGTSRTFTITNCTDIPDSALTWEVKKTTVYTNGNPSSTSTSYYTGRTLTYTASTPRYATSLLQITITNTLRECDPKYITKNFVIKRPFFMSAHTDGDMLYVSIAEDEDREDSRQTNVDAAPQMLELWHNIYGCMRTQHVRSSNEQIDITGLPQGVYVLILKENGNIIAETKVQID